MLFDTLRRSSARLKSAMRNLIRRSEMESDLDAELSAYLELVTEENIARGMAPDEARRTAQLTWGGMMQIKEQVRDAKAGALFETLLQDFRYGGRVLRKNLAFGVVAGLTLTFGIGFTVALFSILNAVLLNPLPYPDASRLVFLGEGTHRRSPGSTSYPDFEDWRSESRSFEFMAAYGDTDTSIGNDKSVVRVHVGLVTQDFFKVFGAPPMMGRDFSAGEHKNGSTTSIIISQALWRGMFGSSPDIIGRTMKLLGGIRCTIVGVMPAGFDFPLHSQAWTVAELGDFGLHERTAHNFRVVGKLKRGAELAAAQQEISAISRRIKKQFPGTYQASDGQVIPLSDYLLGSFKGSLWTLFAAVDFLLLIICVNVANLLLARGTARSHELAIRGALGAARVRLVRQLTIESLTLSMIGGIAGVVLAWWSLRVLKFAVPISIPRVETVSIDGHVLAFAIVLSLVSGLLFGIVPAIAATRPETNELLKQAGSRHSADRGTRRIGTLLVVSEVALVFILLIGTGLLGRSFVRLQNQPAGFEPQNVLTAALSFPITSFDPTKPPPDRVANYLSLAEQIRRIPGVRAVGFTSSLPLTGSQDGHFSIEGSPDLPGFLSDAYYRVVSPEYFRALGTRLIAGRFFSESDGPNTMPVVIINSTMARTVFPDGNALGRRIWFDSFDPERRYMTIVGIVDDIREDRLSRPPMAAGYVCHLQHVLYLTNTNLAIKVTAAPMSYAPAIGRIVRAVNKDVPVTFGTLEDLYEQSIARQRFEAQILGLFAGVGMLLAAIGVYGVLSYLVQQTRTEIGIRMALGASTGAILSRVVSRGVGTALIGILVGLPLVVVITRMLSSMLFEVSAFDPLTYAAAATLLLCVVLLASYLPGRRATKTAPAIALKYD